MGRHARAFCESGIYHIMFRGTNRQELFLSNWDYEKFLEILTEVKGKFGFELFAYCLMSNHVHLVIKEKELRDISQIMHRILTKYARWFNIKYERTGTLLENRYKSKTVDEDEYFLHLIRYVHQNPLKAGLVERLEDYKWSSYADYITDSETITDKAFVKEMLPEKTYVKFHTENEEQSFDLYDNSKTKDIDLINELRKYGVDPPENLAYMQPKEFDQIVACLSKKFSKRHIVRVTGISRNRFRK